MSESTYIVGDVHGCVRTLARVLRRAGLIDGRRRWSGGRSTLYFVGDFTDRGPDGIGVLDLVMRLQDQAQSAGGHIGAILGNHDVFLLAADRFGGAQPAHEFVIQWLRNGGRAADLERLRPRHRVWLASHPAMRRVGDVLVVHADTVMYGAFGDTLEAVNAAVAAIVASADEEAWDVLCACLTAREAFLGPHGAALAHAFLGQFGGTRIVHGHTPIPLLLGCAPEHVREPYVYADGFCVNVDGGMMLGAPGFVYRVDQQET